MRNYDLFILEESVAHHFHGQETKLFHLFMEHHQAEGMLKEIVSKQVTYITEPIPVLKIRAYIKKYMSQVEQCCIVEEADQLIVKFKETIVTISMSERNIELRGNGLLVREVETILFELLRKIEPHFFAVSIESEHYGWLRPFRQDHLLRKTQRA